MIAMLGEEDHRDLTPSSAPPASPAADFTALTCATAIAQDDGVRATRLSAIKADIAKNIRRRGLSIAAVAARHGVTARHVQKLFAADGTTFSAYVLNERLALAHRALSNPRLTQRKISTIVFELGFGDLSYFNREFRRLHGLSPSELRAKSCGEIRNARRT